MSVPMTIEETTGTRRIVILSGRALPVNSIDTGTRQRHSLTWYPGNQEGTLQVLGPEEMPTNMDGSWHDRFLSPGNGETPPAGVSSPDEGAADILSAADLVRLFESLAREGNSLRVEWNTVVREGILEEFIPKWDRPQDVRWSMRWTWYKRDDIGVPRASVIAAPNSAPLRRDMNAVTDTLALQPPRMQPDYTAIVRGNIREMRDRTGEMFDAIRTGQGLATPTLPVGQAMATAADAIREDARSTLASFDLPITAAALTDRLMGKFKADVWRKNVGQAVGVLRGQAQQTSRDFNKRVSPSPIQIVTVQGATTLRRLSLVHYGTADEWQRIADANGITGSIVAAGTQLVIPPPAAQAS